MIKTVKKSLLNNSNEQRTKRIVSKLNIKKLSYNISEENFCSNYTKIFKEISPLFKHQKGDYAMKWCLSTEKRMQVFFLIFEANELGEEVYKESISSKLPEYSYKTIAQIVDDGLKKGYFEKLAPRSVTSSDKKIRNIRPSEDLIVEFINWQIDVIHALSKLTKTK